MQRVIAERLGHHSRKRLRLLPDQCNLWVERMLEQLLNFTEEERSVRSVGEWRTVFAEKFRDEPKCLTLSRRRSLHSKRVPRTDDRHRRTSTCTLYLGKSDTMDNSD